MISYMIGKLAPDSTHCAGGLAKSVAGRGVFMPPPPELGGNLRTPSLIRLTTQKAIRGWPGLLKRSIARKEDGLTEPRECGVEKVFYEALLRNAVGGGHGESVTGSQMARVGVCFLPIHSGHQVRWTYQPGSRRRKVTQDFSSTFFLRCVP